MSHIEVLSSNTTEEGVTPMAFEKNCPLLASSLSLTPDPSPTELERGTAHSPRLTMLAIKNELWNPKSNPHPNPLLQRGNNAQPKPRQESYK